MNRTIRPLARRVILIAGLVTCLAASAFAQGRVRGIVRDEDGNGISGATVTVESFTSPNSRTVTTNRSGRFSFIGLSRGEWLFIIRADGFEPVQGVATVRGGDSAVRVQFTMEADMFNPTAPTTGVLAGLTARELVESLEEAEELFARGEYDAAIDAYRSILERTPALTTLSLQIGHAFREKQEPDQALAAYRMVLDADPSNVEARAAIDAVSQPVR
jgi:hypothetical protein